MHPKDYKNKRIIHPTKIFTLTKGKIHKNGVVTVFDEEGTAYNWEGCYPLYERVCGIASIPDYQALIDSYGREFTDQIWDEFETTYPIDAAAITVALYCETWEHFLYISEDYQVNELYPERKAQFKDALAQRSLSAKVRQMYAAQSAVA
jgi:hypothetical protein